MSKQDEITRFLEACIADKRITEILPSEYTLAEQFQVSRLTVRESLKELAANGIIYSSQGRGWFLRPDNRRTFPLLQLDQGQSPGPQDIWHTWLANQQLHGDALLTVRWEEPPDHVQEHMELKSGEICLARRRIWRIQQQPVVLSVGYFMQWIAENTELARCGEGSEVDMQNPSPLGFLRQIGQAPVYETDIIGTRHPTRAEAETLHIGTGVPVLTHCRTSRNSEGVPVCCWANILAGDQFYLTIDQQHS